MTAQMASFPVDVAVDVTPSTQVFTTASRAPTKAKGDVDPVGLLEPRALDLKRRRPKAYFVNVEQALNAVILSRSAARVALESANAAVLSSKTAEAAVRKASTGK